MADRNITKWWWVRRLRRYAKRQVAIAKTYHDVGLLIRETAHLHLAAEAARLAMGDAKPGQVIHEMTQWLDPDNRHLFQKNTLQAARWLLKMASQSPASGGKSLCRTVDTASASGDDGAVSLPAPLDLVQMADTTVTPKKAAGPRVRAELLRAAREGRMWDPAEVERVKERIHLVEERDQLSMKRGTLADLDGKTVGEVLEDPDLVRQVVSTYGPLKKGRLWIRMCMRFGSWKQAREQGLTDEQAHAMAQLQRPSSLFDALYEADYRRRKAEHMTASPWRPRASAFWLLYPIAAMVWIASYTPPPPVVAIVGYGLAGLGYTLFAAGIFRGTFLVFRLRKRWQVIALAVTCFCVGTALINLVTLRMT